MVLLIAMPGTGVLLGELLKEVRECRSLFAASESSSLASTTTNLRCFSSIRNRSRSQRSARLVRQAEGTMAGFVGPVIVNESNDVDRVAPVEPCMRVESDDPLCSPLSDLLYFVRHVLSNECCRTTV